MDVPAPVFSSYAEPRRPWRTTALVTAVIAAAELVALVVIALAFIAKPFADDGATAVKAQAKPAAGTTAKAPPAETTAVAAAVAELARTKTAVLVLNGNGVSGAAGAMAERVRAFRYPVAGVADASRRDFPRTIVMYRPGFRGEAERLARDLRLGPGRAVPLDGMRPADLDGAQLALVLGG